MRQEQLEGLLSNHYDIPDAQFTLMRSHTNEVFEVTSPTHRYVLKVYPPTWRTRDEVHYETALLQHLTSKGFGVANVVPAVNGDTVILVPGKSELVALFEYAPGQKPQPPFSTKLYRVFGQSIAQVHEYSDDFETTHHRRPLNLEAVVEEPLAVALPHLVNIDDRRFLQETASEVKLKFDKLATQGLDWGPIHGDATLDNLHVTEGGDIVLYDFDSGGPGWRAADLQGWARGRPEYEKKWAAFREGYGSVRELQPIDLEAAPYLAVAWLIWGLQIDLEQRLLKRRREDVQTHLVQQLRDIKVQAELLSS